MVRISALLLKVHFDMASLYEVGATLLKIAERIERLEER